MALVGFKRMTIRVLDGNANPTLGENLFVIEGQTGKGATRTAKISGLASDPVKTYGSDVAYHVSNRGVGDVKMELTAVDIPSTVLAKILGHQVKDEIIGIGADTVAPYCAVMLESQTANGTQAQVGFFKGQFSMDAEELETLKDKQETAEKIEEGKKEGVRLSEEHAEQQNGDNTEVEMTTTPPPQRP